MEADHPADLIDQRRKALAGLRQRILLLSAEKAKDAILDAPQPAALVQSFPEEDLYFLVHDIGVDDCLEILSQASFSQWEYIMDLEIWNRDRIEIKQASRWFGLLQKADPQRFLYWSLNQGQDSIEYFLYRNMDLEIREHDQDPGEMAEDSDTMDDLYYIRFVEYPEMTPMEREYRDTFLSRFLQDLAAYDHVTYQEFIVESKSLLPAEVEEELYRMRNVRLSEKGFLPGEEAVGIYRTLRPEDIGKGGVKSPGAFEKKKRLPVPLYTARVLDTDHLFTSALAHIDPIEEMMELQSEFAGLCNRVISADRKTIRGKEDLALVVRKVCGYLSIGLAVMADGDTKDLGKMAGWIRKYPLLRLFRVGYGQITELKHRAEKWRRGAWFQRQGLPLAFWGESWTGVLGGLLISQPRYFDNYETGELYREFETPAQIEKTKETLCFIEKMDGMLDCMGIGPKTIVVNKLFAIGRFSFKSLLLTLWARNSLGLSEAFMPISRDAFREFFIALWESEGEKAIIRDKQKTSFLKWIAQKSNQDSFKIANDLGAVLKALFEEVESEYGPVFPEDLDPKYVRLFRIRHCP